MVFLQALIRAEKYSLLRAFLAALLLRLVPVLGLAQLGIGLDDMFQYDMLARSLASGNGYRWYAEPDLHLLNDYIEQLNFQLPADYDPRGILTSFRPPLYPAFLAIFYWMVDSGEGRFLVARIAQAFLGATLAPLTGWLTLGLFPSNQRAARLAAWGVACYPVLLLYPLGLATENLFFPLFLASACLLLHAGQTGRLHHFMLAGLLLGLTGLTRSISLACLGAAFVWAFFLLRQRRQAVLMLAAGLLVISPWVVRNSLLHGRLTGIETNLGYNLYLGYHPESTGAFQYGISLGLLPYLDDDLRDRLGREQAWEFIRQAPERFIPLAASRLGYFFGLEKRALVYFYSNNLLGEIPQPWPWFLAVLFLVPFVGVSLLACLGLALLKWNRTNLLLPLVPGAYILPHILILSEDRFHLAIVPFLAALAAFAWCEGRRGVIARWRESPRAKTMLLLSILAACLLLLNWFAELHRDANILVQLLAPGGNQLYLPY